MKLDLIRRLLKSKKNPRIYIDKKKLAQESSLKKQKKKKIINKLTANLH